jgi:hypothetical protein
MTVVNALMALGDMFNYILSFIGASKKSLLVIIWI